MKKSLRMSLGVFAAIICVVSITIPVGHAEKYRACGKKRKVCYLASQTKGKKHCGVIFHNRRMCENLLKSLGM